MMRTMYREVALKCLENEPEFIANLYYEVTGEKVDPSFDTPTNQERISRIYGWWKEHFSEVLSSLSENARLVLDIVMKNFGWLAYDSLDNLIRFISSVFFIDKENLRQGFEELGKKRILFNYEPLTYFSFLFLSPFIELQLPEKPSNENLEETLYTLIPQLIGVLAYLVAYTPRSSEANEIHRIDFQKFAGFFEHSIPPQRLENLIKSFSHIGLVQKYNNRILVQKNIVEHLRSLPVSSLFSLTFLYETLEKLEFQKSTFLTLQWLAYTRHESISLRELFFFFCQHILATLSRNTIKSFKLFLQREEQNFIHLLKLLEKQNIVTIHRNHPLQISRQDTLTLNSFYQALLTNTELSSFFVKQDFIVESNGEIIVEPDLHPATHLELIFMAEPKEIHTIAIYQITKKSIYKALAYGYTVEAIEAFLKSHSRHELPQQVIQNIRYYAEHYIHPSEEHLHILQFASTKSNLIADHFSRESIEIEPHTFLFFDETTYEQVKSFCVQNDISFKENINFLQKKIFPYPNSLEHHIKHLHRFLNMLESDSIFFPQRDILKIRPLGDKDFQLLFPEKSSEHPLFPNKKY
ncbi:helicase-associated domain-containing protein [Thermospira aquatica]|uniref:Helicase-associated domain-containing protein n=1 Tax=Thermospira aquatica TaxID=2828656 RepID=A0AAX3BCY9_9SPIR|nr:helicase-associated domain-containing protein [Thermospira aquatica]URA10107.1 helicase-associated domain-containing protein [Thermospira aquatica]